MNPQPTLGGALWYGNTQLITRPQFLSTNQSHQAQLSTNNFADIGKFSTLYTSTLTSIDGKSVLHIQNTSSIIVSTLRNVLIDTNTFTFTANSVGQIKNNGLLIFDNKDPVTGLRTTDNLTNIFCGEGSLQALSGNLTIGAAATLNLYGADQALFTTAQSQNLTPNGIFDMSGNNLLGVRSLSTINLSTGLIKASDIRANSLSSIFVSTGAFKAGATVLDSLGVSGATSLSNTLNMNSQNITNGGTIGATTGNFTNLTGTLTGNVSGNLTGNVTGNVSGNVSGNLTGNVTGNIYNTNLTVGGQYSITETADVGSAISNYANYGTVNITGKGGLGGIVNITADVATPLNPAFTVSQMTLESKGNYGNFFITPPEPYLGYFPRGGLVQIIARQGLTPTPPATVVSGLAGNGEIDLTAYSYGTVPGLIKLSAGANAIYAGAFSPITGIFGNNYIAATVANSITAGLPPGGVPTFVGTNYLYGYNGTSVQNGLYVDNILNYGNGITYSNLTIGATNSKDVIISNVKTLSMQNTPTIDGATTGSINNFSNINSKNLNISEQGYISSLIVDDIVFNKYSEVFQTLYASTLFTSTITGNNFGTQTLNIQNTSSINISSMRQVVLYGSNVGAFAINAFQIYASNVLFSGSNTMAFDCRGTTQGKVNLLASTLSMYAQNDTLLSANDNQLTLYSGTDTVLTTGGIFYADVAQEIRLNTPQVLVQTHLDTPSLSTINFQATNFLATTTTVANETVAGILTAPTINTITINGRTANFSTINTDATGSVNTTTVNASVGNITTINTATGNITNINTTTTTLQNIKGNPDISISTGTLLLQTTINEPVVITTNYTSYGTFPWVCPPGITAVSITLSGAGGGTNNTGAYSTPGKGGYVSGQYPTTPGQTYNFVVGEGGGVSPAGRQRYGGGGQGTATGCDGGGATFFTTSAGAVIAAAGGGGGGAAINDRSDNVGGDGGGTTGGTGGGSDPAGGIPQTGGNGGTQSAPGTAPTAPSADGNNGSGINGGAGINNTGAGGGGYYGGASGGDNPPSSVAAGGGGGGSSFSTNLGSAVNTQGGGAAITRNGSASVSYTTTDVAPNCIFDAYVDVQNKLTFNEKSIVCWQQGANKTNNGQEWDSGWQTATDPASGMTFSSSEYVMTSALTYTSISQPYAIAWSQVSQQTSGGIWQWQGKLGSATASGTDLQAIWSVQITMIPIELCPGGIVSEVPPAPSYLDIPLNNPYTFLSSITANALTIEAAENMSLLAGIAIPTYLSTGSITIAGTNNIAVIANVVAVGGYTDVDIEAIAGNVNISADAVDINLNANSNVNITASNGDINLTASNLIYTGSSKLWGSNVGNSLGLYRPLRFYYEPPTAAGQSAEINIEAHPADAGVHFSLRYGVDLAGGYGYLLCEWPGYIVVPMKIYGQDIALEGGETVHINANSGNITLHATGSVLVDAPFVDMNSNSIINASNIGGSNLSLYGSNTLSLYGNYTTCTGSNNFNILASNIGIVSSNSFTIDATGSGLQLNGDFKRQLSTVAITQPIIQYGTASGSGASGSVVVTLPTAYASSNSYVAFASMMDVDPARMSVNRDSASQITIYWFQAGSGTQTLGWQTLGT